MTDRFPGDRGVVKFVDLHRANELLKAGGPIPVELRPAVAEIATSATKRRWLGVGYAGLGLVWTVLWTGSHRMAIGVVLGLFMIVAGVVQYREWQRQVEQARRTGLAPATRWGWPTAR